LFLATSSERIRPSLISETEYQRHLPNATFLRRIA
jgi:hypothetical protein